MNDQDAQIILQSILNQLQGSPALTAVDVSDRANRLLGIVYGSQGQQLKQDIIVKSLSHIDHPHENIHEGTKYISSDVVTGIASGVTKLYLVKTPNTSIIHMLFDISSLNSGSTVIIYESPTIITNGGSMTAVNQNRGSINNATLQVFHDPTVSANGTQLLNDEIGSGKVSGGNTSNDRNENEWLLKQNTAYLIAIAPQATTDIATKFRWYEL